MGLQIELLTDDEATIELCTRYWALDGKGGFVHRVADLPLPPGVGAGRVSAFAAQHCRAYDSDVVCRECGRPSAVFTSRSDYQQRARWSTPRTCDDCRRAKAEREQAARDAAVEEKRALVRQQFRVGEQEWLTAPDELSFEEALALLALFRLGAPEGFGAIPPVGEANGLLAPTMELTIDLLVTLYHYRRISVAPETSLDAFTDDGERFYPLNITWLPPMDDEGSPAGVMATLESVFREGTWPEEWYDQCLPFWRKVARHECLQYLKVCMEEHGFEFNPGDKTRQVLDGVLESYAPAQVYNFIWRAAKDAAAYFVRSGVPKRQAANSIVGSLQRMAERGSAEDWEVKPYRRDRRAPESMVSHVLYRVALRLRGEGVERVPYTIAPNDLRQWSSATADDAGPEG